MNASTFSPARRGGLVVFALAAVMTLAYFSIRSAVADHESELQTLQGIERATRLEPNNSRYWYLLGRDRQYSLEDADTSRAIRAYTTALALNPRDAEIWSDLATAYESEGDIPAARDAYLNAKRAYPLSAEVSWRYGNFLLRQGELDEAFQEMKRAVEGDPKRGGEALSRSLRAEPNIDVVLDRVLPPNGIAYLAAIQDQTSDGHTDNSFKLWNRLVPLRPRLQLSDSYFLVGLLRRDRRFVEAQHVWDQAVAFSGFADLPAPAGSVLWDGGFESGILGNGFAWTVPGGLRGAQISIDTHMKHSGDRALELLFNGSFHSDFAGPCHDVLVEPSTPYRFSAWVRTQSLTTEEGVRFQLRSLGVSSLPAVLTNEVHGTQPWTLLETLWSSGAGVREMQVCVARSFSRYGSNNVEGIAWVDDVALIPEAARPAKP